jgi:hypothetical protein
LARLYANSDFFLHPNPHEPFGIAPMESMASGTVLVAPNSGGLTAYANSSNALLTNPTGYDFASAIQDLIRHPEKRRALVRAARSTMNGFSMERATDRYLDLYDQMYCILKGEMPISAAHPVFVSQPPSPIRLKTLRWIANSTARVYSILSRDGGRVQISRNSGPVSQS